MEEKETQQEKPSKRALFITDYRQQFPDDEFDDMDDEAVFERVAKSRDATMSELNKYKEEGKKMTDMFNADPRTAGLFMVLKDGGDPISYLLENFGDEFKDALNNPEKKEEFARKHQEWLQKVANERKLKEECDENLVKSFDELDKLQEENGWSDEQAIAIFDFVHNIVKDGIYNKYSRETYEMAAKALNYDKAVQEAEEMGQVRGRNEQIVEKLKDAKDNLPPNLGGTGGGGEQKRKVKRNMFQHNN